MSFGNGVASEPWPVLAMMDMINLPGAFIERQEALMFGFWIITAFALANAMLFFGGVVVRDVLRNTNLRTGVLITTVAVFAVSIVPFSREQIYAQIDFMYMTTGLFFIVVLPIVLIFAAKITIWGREKMLQKLVRGATLLLVPILGLSLLSGCWDRVEIENRAFVVAMGIDKGEGENYAVTLSVPILNKESDEKPAFIKTAEGQTICEALKKLDAKNDKSLYYGQTKLIVLGTDILKERELLTAAIHTLENKLPAARRIHVLAAEDPAEILEAAPPGEILPGSYIPNMYRDRHKIGGASFTLDFERLSTIIAMPESGAIIPKVEAHGKEKDELQLSGAAVLKNSQKTGRLSPDELRGFLWAFHGGNTGAVVTHENLSLTVDTHKATIKFKENPLRIIISVEAEGKIYGTPATDQTDHTAAFTRTIAEEVISAAHTLHSTHTIDGYNWLELLRKKNYKLYKKHANDWNNIFPHLEISAQVKLDITQ
jgi:Ger(x)C family germination protein